MQITCDKCQTSYQVDDQLIPPGGAPVQCTKCSNLFTAFPAPPQTARAPAKTVMMFAADQAEAPAPARPASGTGVPQGMPQGSRTASGLGVPAQGGGFGGTTPPSAFRTPTGQQPVVPPPQFGSARTQAFGIPVAPAPSGSQPGVPRAPSSSAVPAAPIPRAPSSSAMPVAPIPRAPSSSAVPAAAAPASAQTGSSSRIPVAANPALDQPLDLSRPGRTTQMFYSQGEATEESHVQAAKAAAGEANRKPGQTGMFLQASDLEKQLIRRNRTALYIILVLGIGALLAVLGGMFLPAIIGPPGADRQAVRDRDEALVSLAKDDGQDLLAADKALGDILARKPNYVAAKADRALAEQFLADDRLWQAERLKASYDALVKQVKQITTRNDPNDAPQRAKDLDAMASINKQYEALGKQAKGFEETAKQLIDEAGKADAKDPIVFRARALIAADHDQAEGAQRLAKQYLHEIGKARDGWSELALEESDVNGKASEDKRQDGLMHARGVAEVDPSLIRALYLKVRLDTMNKKEAEAKADVAALTAANPAHLGGASLLAGLEEELAREKLDKEAREVRVAAEAAKQAAAAAAAAAEAEQPKKGGKAKAAGKHNR